ncbi:TlpA family protein disulfide reductase [Lysinibacillus sp. NPDC093190]|uniref:TlpA family protein disulfide reductase n=1 Tax=Lysinibacillus sp. NPDC093190 TaxID=3390575 RepID=UPI003D031AC9
MNDNNLRFLKRFEDLQIGDYIKNGTIDTRNNVKLYDFLDDNLLVCFFSTSCKGCLPVIEELKDFLKKHPNTNSIVLFDSPAENVEFLQKFYNDDTSVFKISKRTMEREFNVYGVPSIFLLNKLGQVLYTELGYMDGMFEQLEKTLLKIIHR